MKEMSGENVSFMLDVIRQTYGHKSEWLVPTLRYLQYGVSVGDIEYLRYFAQLLHKGYYGPVFWDDPAMCNPTIMRDLSIVIGDRPENVGPVIGAIEQGVRGIQLQVYVNHICEFRPTHSYMLDMGWSQEQCKVLADCDGDIDELYRGGVNVEEYLMRNMTPVEIVCKIMELKESIKSFGSSSLGGLFNKAAGK